MHRTMCCTLHSAVLYIVQHTLYGHILHINSMHIHACPRSPGFVAMIGEKRREEPHSPVNICIIYAAQIFRGLELQVIFTTMHELIQAKMN